MIAAHNIRWQNGRGEYDMLTVPLDPDTERKLTEVAKRSGRTAVDFVRDLIQESFDDVEDVRMAVERIESGEAVLTSEEARKALGLDG